jgi:hypothetical protein
MLNLVGHRVTAMLRKVKKLIENIINWTSVKQVSINDCGRKTHGIRTNNSQINVTEESKCNVIAYRSPISISDLGMPHPNDTHISSFVNMINVEEN